MKIAIEISARHIHLCEKDFLELFGIGAKLEKLKDLSQTGQFASNQTVDLKTDKGIIKNVRILGPLRPETQVEISRTDAYQLGVNPPFKVSGDLKDSAGIILAGSAGKIQLKSGMIIAQRHIHASELDAKKYNLKNKQIVSVKILGKRALVFDNVIVRIHKDFVWNFQIDTDEANAAGVEGAGEGEIIIK